MEGKIYQAISNVMADIGAVGKNNTNQFDKYKFRGIDDVMNALYPAMVKNHVFVTPEVLESSREERASKDGKTMMYTILKIKYTFYTDDGSSVECVVVGEAMDRSDKSTNKAMSAGFKYACFQTFCIPTEEMQDADLDSPEIGNKVSNYQTKTESKPVETPKPSNRPAYYKKEEPKEVIEEPKQEENLDAKLNEPVDEDLILHGEGMTPRRLAKLKKCMEFTGKNEKTVLATARAKSFEEITEESYIAVMNLFVRLLTPEQKAEIEGIQ